MKILMTTLFDPDRRDGITSHEASIVSSLTRKDTIDEAVVLTKANKGNTNLPVALAQFGGARLSIFYDQPKMTVATIRLLILYLFGHSGLKFPSRSSVILIGYHWVFWLPFLRKERTIVFVPFDCWSAREIRVAADDPSFIRKCGRHIFGLFIRAFERASAGHVNLLGFVSKDEIDKYVKGLRPKVKAQLLSRAVLLPIAEYSNSGMNREILAADNSKILIWMDGRVGYGVRSIAAAARSIDKWMLSGRRESVSVTLLTRRSDAELGDILQPDSNWNNVEFVDGDLGSFLRSFDIIILPDLSGSGLKNRTIQSIASGACVIATPTAAEGLNAQLRDAIHIAENIDELGDLVDCIFSDIEGARKMALTACLLLSLESQEFGERGEFFNRAILLTMPV